MEYDFGATVEGCGGLPACKEVPITAEELAAALVGAAVEKKAFDIAILEMANLVGYTDLFVICSARNRRQVQAIAEEARKVGKDLTGAPPRGIEGIEAARWVLVDFGPVILHIFDEPLRGFYDLDGLWGDAKRVTLPGVEIPRESTGGLAAT